MVSLRRRVLTWTFLGVGSTCAVLAVLSYFRYVVQVDGKDTLCLAIRRGAVVVQIGGLRPVFSLPPPFAPPTGWSLARPDDSRFESAMGMLDQGIYGPRTRCSLWLVAAVALIAARIIAWRPFEYVPHTCGECGYSLRGNESGVCPECGTHVGRRPSEQGLHQRPYAGERRADP